MINKVSLYFGNNFLYLIMLIMLGTYFFNSWFRFFGWVDILVIGILNWVKSVMFCSSRMIFYWFCRLFAMTERRNIKYMRAFILSLISLYIIYATYFVDMQDDYFNNNKNECIDMQEIFDRLKNRSMFFSQRFLIQSFYG